jgi:hypothetical protein
MPSWRQACVNTDFADAYLTLGQFADAARSARAAVNYESRDLEAWKILLTAQKRLGASPIEIETLLREAALAFKNYPDIEGPFEHGIVESMRARGETSAAEFADNQFAHKVAPERADLNIDHAADLINQSMAADPMETQLRTYYSVLHDYGRGAGMEFFSRIVEPFVDHVQAAGKRADALNAAIAAQSALQIDPNSQLDLEMQTLLTRLKSN